MIQTLQSSVYLNDKIGTFESKNEPFGNFGWIPYHVVSCSSEEYGTSIDSLTSTEQSKNSAWECERLAQFPVVIIQRFHYRIELDYLILESKNHYHIPHVEMFQGDGLSGSFMDVDYRKSGEARDINETIVQTKCYGIGSYLKLVFDERPNRSGLNPYAQISIKQLRVWGRSTSYESKLSNTFQPLKQDTIKINRILLTMGVPPDVLGWYEQDNRTYDNMPIDEETKITIQDMKLQRDQFLKTDDFEGLKQIGIDLKKIMETGRQIQSFQKELEFVVNQEDFDKAIDLKEQIRSLETTRDTFDALYETSRYERMVVMQRPNTADYNNSMSHFDKTFQDQIDEMERTRMIEEERSMLGKTGFRDDIEEEENHTQYISHDNIKLPGAKDEGTPERFKKKSDVNFGKASIQHQSQKIEVLDNNVKNNPMGWNEGDDELDPYLKPHLSSAGGKFEECGAEVLVRLQNQGLLNVFGARTWSCSYASDWKVRLAAAQAVLDYISMPLTKRYMSKSKKLFMACIELGRILSEDKLLQIYYLALNILTVALKPPICGEDCKPNDINKILAEFAPIILKKISELNYRARDISMHTLISLYRHPAAQLQSLIDSCMDLCEKQKDYVLYGKSRMPPIEKQAPRQVQSRIELVLQIQQEFGYEDNYEWRDVFHFLLIPSLFHPNNEVRTVAIELTLMFYQLMGDEVKDIIFNVSGLKHQIVEEIMLRMEELKDVMNENQRKRGVKGLEDIQEADEEDEAGVKNGKKNAENNENLKTEMNQAKENSQISNPNSSMIGKQEKQNDSSIASKENVDSSISKIDSETKNKKRIVSMDDDFDNNPKVKDLKAKKEDTIEQTKHKEDKLNTSKNSKGSKEKKSEKEIKTKDDKLNTSKNSKGSKGKK